MPEHGANQASVASATGGASGAAAESGEATGVEEAPTAVSAAEFIAAAVEAEPGVGDEAEPGVWDEADPGVAGGAESRRTGEAEPEVREDTASVVADGPESRARGNGEPGVAGGAEPGLGDEPEPAVGASATATGEGSAATDGLAAVEGLAGDEPGAIGTDEDELSNALRERDEYLLLARRAQADFENYRRRMAEESAVKERRARGSMAKSIAPVIDNLERALVAAGVNPQTENSVTPGDSRGEAGGEAGGEAPISSVGSVTDRALAEGVALVYRDLVSTLERAGVFSFDPTGEAFDPKLHDAVSTRPAEEGAAAGVVVEALTRGYRLGEDVLRAAQVIVSE